MHRSIRHCINAYSCICGDHVQIISEMFHDEHSLRALWQSVYSFTVKQLSSKFEGRPKINLHRLIAMGKNYFFFFFFSAIEMNNDHLSSPHCLSRNRCLPKTLWELVWHLTSPTYFVSLYHVCAVCVCVIWSSYYYLDWIRREFAFNVDIEFTPVQSTIASEGERMGGRLPKLIIRKWKILIHFFRTYILRSWWWMSDHNFLDRDICKV